MALSDAAMAPWLSWRAWIQEQVELTVPQRGEAVEGGQPAWFMQSWSPSAPQPPAEVVAGLGLLAMAQGGVLNKKVVGLRAWAGWDAGCPYLSSFPGPGTLQRKGKCSQGSWGPGEGFLIPQICRSDFLVATNCWVSLRTNLQNVKFPGQILPWCSVWIITLSFLLWRGRKNGADQESHGETFSKIEFIPILSCSWRNSWGKKSDVVWPKVAGLVNGRGWFRIRVFTQYIVFLTNRCLLLFLKGIS